MCVCVVAYTHVSPATGFSSLRPEIGTNKNQFIIRNSIKLQIRLSTISIFYFNFFFCMWVIKSVYFWIGNHLSVCVWIHLCWVSLSLSLTKNISSFDLYRKIWWISKKRKSPKSKEKIATRLTFSLTLSISLSLCLSVGHNCNNCSFSLDERENNACSLWWRVNDFSYCQFFLSRLCVCAFFSLFRFGMQFILHIHPQHDYKTTRAKMFEVEKKWKLNEIKHYWITGIETIATIPQIGDDEGEKQQKRFIMHKYCSGRKYHFDKLMFWKKLYDREIADDV